MSESRTEDPSSCTSPTSSGTTSPVEAKPPEEVKPPGRRRGRPPKEKRPVGRPKGEAAIMKEYRDRMLNSPKSRKVLDSVFAAALEDNHKHQAAAWKLILDRVAPVSGFEQNIQKNATGSFQLVVKTVGDDTPKDIQGVEIVQSTEDIENVES